MDAAIEETLEIVTPMLASDLRVPDFGRATTTDYFRVQNTEAVRSDIPLRRSVSEGYWREVDSVTVLLRSRFRLSRGFLDSVAADDMPAYAAALFEDLTVPTFQRDDLRSFGNNDTDHVEGFAERGVVIVQDLDLSGKYVQIGPYDSGFYENSDGVAEGVPDWLQRLAQIDAALMLTTSPVFRREDQQTDFLDTLRKTRDALMRAHIRYEPGMHKPIEV